jgi:hypothetical protein
MLIAGEASGDRQATMLAHLALGVVASAGGWPADARAHLQSVLDLHREAEDADLCPETLGDVKAGALAWLGYALWGLDHPEQGLRRIEESIIRARAVDRSLLLATALNMRIHLHMVAREDERALPWIEELLRVVSDRRLEPLRPFAGFCSGWLLVRQGSIREGLAQMIAAAEAQWQQGMPLGVPAQLVISAQTALLQGQTEQGLAALDRAAKLQNAGLGGFYEAEQQRLRGELLLQAGDSAPGLEAFPPSAAASAETCFRTAIAVARERGTRMFELRAASSLARLRERQGRASEACHTGLAQYRQ